MKLLNMMLIALVLFGVGVLLPGCASKPATTVTGQVVTVRRGNLTTNITGVGNLALSHTEDLAFDIPSAFFTTQSSKQTITVEEVSVKAGDSVQEGQVLAKLDTSLWDDQVTALQDAVTTTNGTVTTKERAVTQAQLTVLTRQSAVNSAELSLENTEASSTDPLQIRIAELNLEVAKGNLAAANTAVDDANTAVEDAKKTVETAKKALEDAKKASPEVKAPFAGFITNVNVSGGAEVKKGTIAMTIADPNKFEANILVNEMNMSQVKLGGAATVTLDSIPGLILAANLTQISPTATIQSSVVNYQVKVEIQSLQPVTQARQQASANATSANISSSQFPNRSRQSSDNSSSANISSRQGSSSGNFTQEQIQAMINQRQQSATGQSQRQTSTTVPTSFQLRQGLTVTVSIIVQERSNVLLVPNQAITLQQGQAYVQVQKADGTTEQRTIQTGINNSQYTEVTSGLNEGENIIVPLATTTSSTTSSTTQQRAGGGTFIPGLGGLGR